MRAETYVYPGFDNIIARRKRLGAVLRSALYRAEHTPLRVVRALAFHRAAEAGGGRGGGGRIRRPSREGSLARNHGTAPRHPRAAEARAGDAAAAATRRSGCSYSACSSALGLIAVAAMGIAGFAVYRSYANGLQPPDQVIAQQPSGGAQIYDRHGNLLYEYVDDRSGLRSPVKLADISPYLIAATISTEDYSFWSNPGVNVQGPRACGPRSAAPAQRRRSDRRPAASSITQQLVKNIYIAPEDQRNERSYSRKLKETVYALELTNNYSKDQILEWYLNQIPLRRALQRRRGGVRGLFRQAREGPDSAGSGDARRHRREPGAVRPCDEPRRRDRAAQRGAAPDALARADRRSRMTPARTCRRRASRSTTTAATSS